MFHPIAVIRPRGLVVMACSLGSIAALGLAVHWFNAETTEEAERLWTLAELQSVRGPRDLWDFVTGEGVRRRREARRLCVLALRYVGRHSVQFELHIEPPITMPWDGTNPAEWSVDEIELRAVVWMAELGARPCGEPHLAQYAPAVVNRALYVATRSKLRAGEGPP
jgi:hypothetical protein